MKQSLINFWGKFVVVSPYIVKGWLLVLLSIIVIRITDPDVLNNASSGLWVLIGTIVTSVIAVPIIHKFKSK